MAFIALTELPRAVRRIGVSGTIKLLASRRRFRRYLPRWTTRLNVRPYPFPFHFRHGTTDKYVIVEVFLRGQYDCLCRLNDVTTIVDAGANIGTTSVLLLNAYPRATVVALEPDRGNFELLQANLARYGSRAIALRQALWHRAERLIVEKGDIGGGGEWAFRVKPAPAATGDEVQGTTLLRLMKDHDLASVDILKIDIEGGERTIFSEDPSFGWLDRVRTVAVELHDADSREMFARATLARGGRLSERGEITIWNASAATS